MHSARAALIASQETATPSQNSRGLLWFTPGLHESEDKSTHTFEQDRWIGRDWETAARMADWDYSKSTPHSHLRLRVTPASSSMLLIVLAFILAQCCTSQAKIGIGSSFKLDETPPILSVGHPRLVETALPVEQVHLTATDRVFVNFVTKKHEASVVQFRLAACGEGDPVGRMQLDDVCNREGFKSYSKKKHHKKKKHHDKKWETANGTAEVYSSLNFYTPTDDQGRPIKSERYWGKYTNPKDWYTSGYCHSVELPHLHPGALYEYRIPPMTDTRYFFRAPRAVSGVAPTRIGVIGDMGQTNHSLETLDRMWAQLQSKASIDQVLMLGDLAYSDGYGPRWDTYGRMVEPLLAHVPTAVTGGNHEFEFGESWVGLRTRWPMPPPRGRGGTGDVTSPLYYSYEAGPLHVISLCSYLDPSEGSPLYRFVEADLQAIDRSRTPWVIVFMHVPWYTSNADHTMVEGSLMRHSLEPLFIAARVNLVLAGHVHAYERTHYVGQGGRLGRCAGGIMHVTLGDGGNREGFAPWIEPQPPWSAVREDGRYGYGVLEVESDRLARWEWWRNDVREWPAESVVLERGECSERAAEATEEEEGRGETETETEQQGRLGMARQYGESEEWGLEVNLRLQPDVGTVF